MSVIFCRNCGKKYISDTGAVCPECGCYNMTNKKRFWNRKNYKCPKCGETIFQPMNYCPACRFPLDMIFNESSQKIKSVPFYKRFVGKFKSTFKNHKEVALLSVVFLTTFAISIIIISANGRKPTPLNVAEITKETESEEPKTTALSKTDEPEETQYICITPTVAPVPSETTITERYASPTETQEFELPLDEMISNYQNKNSIKIDWETGEYKAVVTVGDYIYYCGPYYFGNGNADGMYGLRMYNTKTREDVAIIHRPCRIDVIGDKVFVIGGGVSSGSYHRNLIVYDIGKNKGTKVVSGVDMDFAFSKDPYLIYKDRIYLGHQTDTNSYEVISFNTEGEDIRVEVPPVGENIVLGDVYETFAVINNKIYYYQ